MRKIPVCPYCGKWVDKIIESQTWIHKAERVKEVFHEYGKDVYTLEPDPKGEWRYIGHNEGKTFTCAECGEDLGNYFGVMGFYDWISSELDPKGEDGGETLET